MMNCHSSGIMGRSAISHFLNFSSYISALARETRCPTHQDTIYPIALNISVLLFGYTESLRQSDTYTWLFCNY